jgi:hypothetical protein
VAGVRGKVSGFRVQGRWERGEGRGESLRAQLAHGDGASFEDLPAHFVHHAARLHDPLFMFGLVEVLADGGGFEVVRSLDRKSVV